MKPLLALLLAFSFTIASTEERLTKELNSLSVQQYKVLVKTYVKGYPFDYGYTLTAIAWKESCFGKYPINLGDPSFGVFHSLLSTVVSRNNVSETYWNTSRIAERLLLDFDFSFSQALAELKFWENYWTSKGVSRVWSHTVQSYNAGFNRNVEAPYRDDILLRIQILKKFFKGHKGLLNELETIKD